MTEPTKRLSGTQQPNVLALATSTERCEVALLHGVSARMTAREAPPGATGSGSILDLIQALLAESGMARDELDVIAFDSGPGAFTGVRLGCAVAQGLGLALQRPLVSVSSLQIVARVALSQLSAQIRLDSDVFVRVATDARMSEVYCAQFLASGGRLEPFGEPRVLAAPHAVAWFADSINDNYSIDDNISIAAGNGFSRFDLLANLAAERGWRSFPLCWPQATALAEIATEHWRAGTLLAAGDAEPLYVRDKVALDLTEQRRQT